MDETAGTIALPPRRRFFARGSGGRGAGTPTRPPRQDRSGASSERRALREQAREEKAAAKAEKARLKAMSAPLLANYRKPGMNALGKWTLIGLLAVSCIAFGYGFAINAPQLIMPFVVPPVLVAALLIWALPAGDYAPTGAVGVLFWGYFLALVVWPNYLAIALPGLPWLTLLRIFGGPLAALTLICVSVSGDFRAVIARCLKDSPLIWKSLVFYIFLITISMAMTPHIGDSINHYVVFQLNETCIFFVSAYVFLRPKRVEYWIYGLLAMCVIISMMGVWENHLGFVPWAGHIPSFLKIEDQTVTRILAGGARAATGIHRVSSVQTTPLGLAEMLGLAAPFALHVALSRAPIYIRAAAFACIPLFIYTIILTDARLGFVAMLVAAALYLLLWAVVRWRARASALFAPAIVISYPAIFCAMVASTFLVGKIHNKVWGDGSQAASNASRKAQWQLGIPKVVTHPFGHGYGEAGTVLGWVNLGGVPSIDSYYLNLLLDTGFLGFFTFMVLFLGSAQVAATTVIKHPENEETRLLMPCAVSLVAFIIIKAVLSQDANHPLVFMILGAIVALVHRAVRGDKAAKPI